ncbi:MAG: HicB family protein [Syntrophus sp. (in: bacteria)]|nr:HicB family protein [Syntrophus sp. (in: bacteria)]
MRSLKYVVYREGKYFVSQCLNVEVSSFGKNIDEAVTNLKDAVELYLKDDSATYLFHDVGDALIGEAFINA